MKVFFPIALGFFLLVLILLMLILNLKTQGFQKNGEDASRAMPNLQPKIQRPLDTSGFSNRAYIVPLQPNATGSLYSSRVQLRGVVGAWSDDTLRVRVNDSVKEIRLPVAVKLYCPPSSFIDKDGNRVSASGVGLDFSRSPDVGTLMAIDNISRRLPKGGDVTILAHVGDGDVMTAYLIVGYGCGEK